MCLARLERGSYDNKTSVIMAENGGSILVSSRKLD